MTIKICSPGRTGSGWLTSVLCASGFSCSHEWWGNGHVDVVADTSWIWSPDQFIAGLKQDDMIVVLDRAKEERDNSVNKLLETESDWEQHEVQWTKMKKALMGSVKERVIAAKENVIFPCWIDHEDLTSDITRDRLYDFLGPCEKDRWDNVWHFFKGMNVRNRWAENGARASWGLKEI